MLPQLVNVNFALSSFSVIFKYSVAWSDRYATHPCTISLYPYGKGIPKGSAAVKVYVCCMLHVHTR